MHNVFARHDSRGVPVTLYLPVMIISGIVTISATIQALASYFQNFKFKIDCNFCCLFQDYVESSITLIQLFYKIVFLLPRAGDLASPVLEHLRYSSQRAAGHTRSS